MSRTVPVGAASGSRVGAPVTADDVDDPVLVYRLSGPDASQFAIDETTAQITVAADDGLDATAGSEYTLTVEASDPLGESDTTEVTVTVAARVGAGSSPGGGPGGGLGAGGPGGGPVPAVRIEGAAFAGVGADADFTVTAVDFGGELG